MTDMLTPLREAWRRLTPAKVAQPQGTSKRRKRNLYDDKWQFKTE